MPTIANPASKSHFEPVFHENDTCSEHLGSQTDSYSAYSSHPSSPESKPIDVGSPIPEEDEETSSEAGNEPLTPIELPHLSAHLKTDTGIPHDIANQFDVIPTRPPLIVNTSATPPTSSSGRPTSKSAFVNEQTPKSPFTKKATPSRETTGLRRAVTHFFKRSNSSSSHLQIQPLVAQDQSNLDDNGSDPMLGKEHRRMSIRRGSATASPLTSRSNTPPSPGVIEREFPQDSPSMDGAAADDYISLKKKNRSSTGLTLRGRIQKKISFVAPEKTPKHERGRATSVDLDSTAVSDVASGSEIQAISRQLWGMAAETGIGLKSRRMSLSLPDDFNVDTVELYSEYQDQSKIVGRRGKNIGKGATANVKLMIKKNGSHSNLFAVKEFRGKSSAETEEDYEKKVKSEYSIAKSAHHPNIVHTFRLCTHNGRWNHVMEYCEQGDLFSLVNQRYLAREDHQIDRLCLFKQLIQGLNYLHAHGIAHRDVKLENLLITKDSKLKITDFGVSEVFAGIHPGLRAAQGLCGKDMGQIRLCAPGICGSPPYIAPEVIEKKGEYDPRPLDVWGAAIVMLCMCANGCLWGEAKAGSSPLYDELVRGWAKWNTKHVEPDSNITDTDYPHVAFFDKHINPPALRRVLLTMLNPNPTKRITIAEVAKKGWLKNLECCQVDSYDDPTDIIDASKLRTSMKKSATKVVQHNHLPPHHHNVAHKLVRLPGSTDM